MGKFRMTDGIDWAAERCSDLLWVWEVSSDATSGGSTFGVACPPATTTKMKRCKPKPWHVMAKANRYKPKPCRMWVLFDIDNGSCGLGIKGRNYLWWFTTRDEAREFLKNHNKDSKRRERLGDTGLTELVGPVLYRCAEKNCGTSLYAVGNARNRRRNARSKRRSR